MIIQTAEFEAGHIAVVWQGLAIEEIALGATAAEAVASLDTAGEASSGTDIALAVLEAWRSGSLPSGISLYPQGTGLQMMVWQSLRELASGATLTYSDLAARIGLPKAVRAVASACARNRIGLLIPCHRVVHKDGRIGGYRWGPELKSKLLALETRGMGV